MKPISLLVLAGGRSAEHSISLVSAWNLCNKLKGTAISVDLITIDKQGNWYHQEIDRFLDQTATADAIHFGDASRPIMLRPGNDAEKLYDINAQQYLHAHDVVFPLLHGPNGEDGSMQGLLRHLQLPFIGPEVLGSALCMDKQVAKQLMQQAGIPTSAFVTLLDPQQMTYDEVKDKVGLPMFVKPANMGSSVGINKVHNDEEFLAAVKEAFLYDSKIIIEEFVDGIEVECAVLGNDDLVVSVPGTYVHSDEFFDFDTKYLKGDEVKMQIPAKLLTEAEQQFVMELSLRAYKTLACEGLARVDTFFTKDRRFLVNEINTLPGFTQHSMYPVLMEQTGIPYDELVYRLCQLAIERMHKS